MFTQFTKFNIKFQEQLAFALAVRQGGSGSGPGSDRPGPAPGLVGPGQSLSEAGQTEP